MLISHRNQFIFIKTPKTAGTSVESYFEKYCLPDGQWFESHDRDQSVCEEGLIGGRGSGKHDVIHSHMSAKLIKKLVSEEQWNTYFKFSVIRNPFDRLVSRYFFHKHKQGEDISRLSVNEIAQDFESLVRDRKYPLIAQLQINNQLCTDFLIRYEKLSEDIQVVCEKLDIPFEPENLPVFKSGIRPSTFSMKDLYSDSLIGYVNEVYADELSLFDYKFIDLNSTFAG